MAPPLGRGALAQHLMGWHAVSRAHPKGKGDSRIDEHDEGYGQPDRAPAGGASIDSRFETARSAPAIS